MKRFSDFRDFDAEEFAANESFQSYFFGRSEDDIAFWEDFINAHPEKLSEIKEARQLLAALKFQNRHIPRQERQFELDRLLSSLAGAEEEKAPGGKHVKCVLLNNVRHRVSAMNILGVAASVSVVITILFGGFFFLRSVTPAEYVTYETGYGESITYILPDSTILTLNANSRVFHRNGWGNRKLREVWLEGEAFFDVKHRGTSGNSRFIVHTPGMDVEVLGTKFNVFNRNDKANVVLNSGRVKVKIASAKDTSTVLMLPDQSLEFSRKDLTVSKKEVKAESLTSWRNQVLVLENTPLSHIGELIQYTYGIDVRFTGNVDVTEGLTGTVPCENIDVLLDVLAKSSNLLITKEQGQIIIAKPERKSTQYQPKNKP